MSTRNRYLCLINILDSLRGLASHALNNMISEIFIDEIETKKIKTKSTKKLKT